MIDGIIGTIVTIVLFFTILGSLVVVHEVGHFVTARLAKVRVLEFGIGFPPRAKVMRASGETLYTLNWLPIGGFVKLEGEDGDDTNDPHSFANASLPIRLVILAAGVAMNLLAAFAIFFLIAWLVSPRVGITAPIVEPGSPAEQAGLRSGDSIVSVNGRTYEFLELSEFSVLDDLRNRAGETVTLGVTRADGGTDELTVTLRSSEEIGEGRGALGIRVAEGQVSFPLLFTGSYAMNDPGASLGVAASETIRWFTLILEGLGSLVSGFVADPGAPPPVQGPVGIATSIGQVWSEAGPIMTLYVAGILSANLALVNALPFPPLDGGRALVIVLKSIFGRRISLQAERLTYFVGFAFLMAFLLWVTVFDVLRGGSPP
ncbi:MAG TPA: M50 family metallopeptidase [Vitreimonas sp.]|nr:M50 family metallopeptidase [Vitreimonas sp.]